MQKIDTATLREAWHWIEGALVLALTLSWVVIAINAIERQSLVA